MTFVLRFSAICGRILVSTNTQYLCRCLARRLPLVSLRLLLIVALCRRGERRWWIQSGIDSIFFESYVATSTQEQKGDGNDGGGVLFLTDISERKRRLASREVEENS